MQRLLSRHRLRSSVVSFPSLPSLLVRSGLELEEDWLLVILDEPELAELGELLGRFKVDRSCSHTKLGHTCIR